MSTSILRLEDQVPPETWWGEEELLDIQLIVVSATSEYIVELSFFYFIPIFTSTNFI